MTVKRPPRGLAWITGSLIALLVAVGLVFYRDLAVAFHTARLGGDPAYLLRVVGAAGGSTAEESLSAYLETPSGHERLRASLVSRMLEHLSEPGVGTSAPALDPAAWDRIELEVRRLHYDGAAGEWWVVFSARDDTGRGITGSVRADEVLVALERRLIRVGEAASVRLPDHPGIDFVLLPSDVETGEWKVVTRRAAKGKD